MINKSMKTKSLGFSILLTAFVCSVFFQNCSRIQFSSELASLGTKSENNGGGYSGKPSGEYYRFEPGFKCENTTDQTSQEAYVEHISVGTEVIRTENKRLACGAVMERLDDNLIDASIFQNEVVGYKAGIYEGRTEKPTAIPANLVEVWCRDRNDGQGIETLTHFDRTTNLAMNRTYYAKFDGAGNLQNQMVPDAPVARVLTANSVRLNDGNGFELIVYRNQPAAEAGLFNADLKIRLDGKDSSRATFCRLGGSLDVREWPAKQIVDMNVEFSKYSPDLGSFVMSTGSLLAPTASKRSLITMSVDGYRQSKVSDAIGLSDYSFHFSSDSQRIAFMEGSSNSSSGALFSVRADGSAKTQLADDVTTATTYKISADGQSLIYNQGSVIGSWLKTAPLTGGNSVEFSPVPIRTTNRNPTVQTTFAYRFEVSANSSKVAFLCCYPAIDLYVSNADGSNIQRVTPVLPAGYVPYGALFPEAANDSLLQVHAWTDANVGPVKYMNLAVKLDGSGSMLMPEGWLWNKTSPSGKYGLITNQVDAEQNRVMDLQTGALVSLPRLQRGVGFFTKDSAGFVGIQKAAKSADQATLMKASTGEVTELCSGVEAAAIYKGTASEFILLSKVNAASVLKVYAVSSSGVCREVNSVPMAMTKTSSLSAEVAGDGSKIAVLSGSSQLFMIPLDGKPALHVNTPVEKSATIRSFKFVRDGKAIHYIGDQENLGMFNVYLWTVP